LICDFDWQSDPARSATGFGDALREENPSKSKIKNQKERKGSRMSFSLEQLQRLIRDTYDQKDRRRGVEGTFMWFMEEVGELAAALRGGDSSQQAEEFADVLAWLATMANIVGVDLDAAVQAKYGDGCPDCRRSPCVCDRAEKP
jgi:NTP pyrophosphatase (non-canonical NTP hydrolase)